jgi:hypothetical protein
MLVTVAGASQGGKFGWRNATMQMAVPKHIDLERARSKMIPAQGRDDDGGQA